MIFSPRHLYSHQVKKPDFVPESHCRPGIMHVLAEIILGVSVVAIKHWYIWVRFAGEVQKSGLSDVDNVRGASGGTVAKSMSPTPT